jgi:hypothetical protein
MRELRPIGTEFWYVYPIDIRNPALSQVRFLYRVVRHSQVKDAPNQEPYMTESLEPLRMQRRHPVEIGCLEFGASGQMMMVPIKYTEWEDADSEWKDWKGTTIV